MGKSGVSAEDDGQSGRDRATGLRALVDRFRPGRLEAILLRPARGVEMSSVESVRALVGYGLEGDRAARISPQRVAGGKRQAAGDAAAA